MKGIVLFGHGARSPEWARPFHAIQDALRARSPQTPVALGFLEIMRPTLDEAIADLVGRGATHIVVVPIFLSTGSHIAKDLPLLVASAMDRNPGTSIDIALPAGQASSVIDAMAIYALNPTLNDWQE